MARNRARMAASSLLGMLGYHLFAGEQKLAGGAHSAGQSVSRSVSAIHIRHAI